MATKKSEIKTFEEALTDLENVIEQLERDDLTLDKALLHFEDGIRLMRHCDTHLKSAQGKLKELLKGEDGEFITEVLGISLESFIGGEEING